MTPSGRLWTRAPAVTGARPTVRRGQPRFPHATGRPPAATPLVKKRTGRPPRASSSLWRRLTKTAWRRASPWAPSQWANVPRWHGRRMLAWKNRLLRRALPQLLLHHTWPWWQWCTFVSSKWSTQQARWQQTSASPPAVSPLPDVNSPPPPHKVLYTLDGPPRPLPSTPPRVQPRHPPASPTKSPQPVPAAPRSRLPPRLPTRLQRGGRLAALARVHRGVDVRATVAREDPRRRDGGRPAIVLVVCHRRPVRRVFHGAGGRRASARAGHAPAVRRRAGGRANVCGAARSGRGGTARGGVVESSGGARPRRAAAPHGAEEQHEDNDCEERKMPKGAKRHTRSEVRESSTR